MIKWIQQSAQKQDKKCGSHSSIFHSVYPVKRKKNNPKVMRNHHLGSLRNFPFSTAVMIISDSPGVTIHPAQPVSPACAQMNPVNTRSCQRQGDLGHLPGCLSPNPQQPCSIHPPTTVGLFGGFRDFFLQKFCLEEWEQDEGHILNRKRSVGRHLYLHC